MIKWASQNIILTYKSKRDYIDYMLHQVFTLKASIFKINKS